MSLKQFLKIALFLLDKYLNTHIDELISLTEYNKKNKIYDLVTNQTDQKIKIMKRGWKL